MFLFLLTSLSLVYQFSVFVSYCMAVVVAHWLGNLDLIMLACNVFDLLRFFVLSLVYNTSAFYTAS